ncbi:MAG: V-type ATP synthase subunit D [Gammaproteobacteria bacterium]|nr:V-type ATP synthase subunit D [Gammaproteobacteria bacterium]HXK56118.1 V-type ATP synthase subunit D [Gammaproteobacteria bacterium]
MNQQRIKAPPTKNTLLSLKKQVRFLQDGHALLERKRELLTRLIYQHIDEYRAQRELARNAIKQAYHWMSISYLRMGSRSLHQAGLGIKPSVEIDIIPKHSLGVEFPAINARELPLQPMGLLGTDTSFDETRKQLTAAAIQLARLGEAEMALGRLMAEQRKARKRVNALKYNIIPKYLNTIRYIESVLEEEERNVLFQIKLLRER